MIAGQATPDRPILDMLSVLHQYKRINYMAITFNVLKHIEVIIGLHGVTIVNS